MGRTQTLIVAALATAFTAVEAAAQVTVEGEPVKRQRAGAGETYSGVFALRNSSNEPQEVRLYQTDYSTSADGTTTYGEPGRLARSNASWVGLGPSRVTVPPRQAISVPFSVAVPQQRPLSGSYWSLVMVETVPRGSRVPAARPGQMMIISQFRYAVAIITDVPVDEKREAAFDAPAVVVEADSARVLQFDVKNTGNLAYRPVVSVELYSDDGRHVKTLTATREMSYPGTSFRHRFNFGRLPRGKYRAIVTVDTGEATLFGAQYTLNV